MTAAIRPDAPAPLVVHLLYRFDCGGLQTLLAECINRMPAQRYRHAVVCLAGHGGHADRIRAPGVAMYSLDKSPGQDLGAHLRLWKLLRSLRPAVVHSYNVGAIEYQLTAFLAGVPVRIHAEHGRDSAELDGRQRRYVLLRRLLAPLIDAFVPVSSDLADWLRRVVKVAPRKIETIQNGVDSAHFAPGPQAGEAAPPGIRIGAVGRVDRIKHHAGLLDAFALLLARCPAPRHDLRLVIVGDGPLLPALRARVAAEGLGERVCLMGDRRDVAEILRACSIFVLPSLSEATPVTLLEAMATGLPVVASRVGGVPQLVLEGETGILAPPGDAQALADALATYAGDPALRTAHGAAGRQRVEAAYGVEAMVAAYAALYDRQRVRKGGATLSTFTSHDHVQPG